MNRYIGSRHPVIIEPMRFHNGTPCMPWPGKKNNTGYGCVSHGHCWRLAHRLVYEAHRGPIPDGAVLDHLCRNRKCVNPDHLEPVTMQINNLRGFGASGMNHKKTHCIRGHSLSSGNVARKGVQRKCRTCAAHRERIRKSMKVIGRWSGLGHK